MKGDLGGGGGGAKRRREEENVATSAWNEASESIGLGSTTISIDGRAEKGPCGWSTSFLALAPLRSLGGL